jgi:hypothetical protein
LPPATAHTSSQRSGVAAATPTAAPSGPFTTGQDAIVRWKARR